MNKPKITQKNGDKITLSIGDKMTINLGDYQNRNPFWHINKEIIIVDGIERDLNEEAEEMKEFIRFNLERNINSILNQKKIENLNCFRFYEREINGIKQKYISVTSVLNPEPKSPELEAKLAPYGARGTALHRQFAHLIENGKTTNFTQEEIDACSSVGGFIGYEFWFLEDKRFDFRLAEVEVYSDEHLYAGRYDVDGFYDKKSMLGDLKSGSLNKAGIDKAFMQLSAYNACLEEPKDVLVIIPVSPKVKKEPIVIEGEQIKKYYDIFLAKRREFKTKYGC